ncbi:MAG TPA: response regulator transcription factor [Crocinitomix sp.]|nr:response regulator transcription factor [Crocinitomix sp.]
MNEINILLVEDDTNLGFLIQDTLKSEGYNVQLCLNGVEGLKKFNDKTYHLCILDVMMPKKDGFTLAKDIRQINSKTPILFLTAKAQTADKIEGLKAGGDDYLTKPFNSEEFMLRVKALIRRSNPDLTTSEPKVFKIGETTFDSENFKLIYKDKEEKKLTKKESKILLLLVQHKHKVLPREVVLNAVWGQDDYFVGRSLDVFITKIRKYLKPDDKVKIENVHGVGFKLED